MDIKDAKACPVCGVPAKASDRIPPGETRTHHSVECSNQVNCPVWPVTRWFPTMDEAVRAWNNNETH